MRAALRTIDEATVRLIDGLVGFWLVLWLVLGAWSGYTLWQLSDLGDTVTRSGQALDSAGQALETVGELPVVGDGPAELGREVVGAAEDITVRGQELRSQLRRLSLLLGLSITLIPITPVLGLYLPMRLARRREVRALAQAIRRHPHEPGLDRYLAERALGTLPYATVLAISADPWQDIETGQTGALADAELARLGLRYPSRG